MWAGEHEFAGALKAIVTESKRMIEPKGVDPIQVDNFTRLIISSNEEWIVGADIDDRRFCILECGNERKEDSRYFQAIQDEMDNGGREALLHLLLERDLSGADIRKFPKTRAGFDNIYHGMNSVQKFWYNYLNDARGDDWKFNVKCDLFYIGYKNYHKEEVGFGLAFDKARFGKEIKKMCSVERVRKMESMKKGYYYKLPDLKECRKQFSNLMKRDIPWGDEFESGEVNLVNCADLENDNELFGDDDMGYVFQMNN
jgi:hypothetical protein